MIDLDDFLGPQTGIQKLAEDLVEDQSDMMRALRQRRIDAGLSIEQVAERCGADPEKIRDFEAYQADPTLGEIRMYALATGTMICHTVTDAGTEPVIAP